MADREDKLDALGERNAAAGKRKYVFVSKSDIYSAVRKRDFSYLVGLVRGNPDMEPDVREYLANELFDLLTGKTKFPRHRPSSDATEERLQAVTSRFMTLHGTPGWEKKSAVVAKVAAELKVSTKYVWNCLAEIERRRDEEMEEAADWAAELYREGYFDDCGDDR
jgi:hypothetical protein